MKSTPITRIHASFLHADHINKTNSFQILTKKDSLNKPGSYHPLELCTQPSYIIAT